MEAYELETDEKGMRLASYLIDEVRAHAKIVEYHNKVSFFYNVQFKKRFFREENLILRKIKAYEVGQKENLAPNWEGPCQIKQVLRRGSYKLEIWKAKKYPKFGIASNLKTYYI